MRDIKLCECSDKNGAEIVEPSGARCCLTENRPRSGVFRLELVSPETFFCQLPARGHFAEEYGITAISVLRCFCFELGAI